MRKLNFKQLGMSLIEVVASLGAMSVIGLSVAYTSDQSGRSRRQELLKQSIIQSREQIVQSLNSKARWTMTVHLNPNLSCIKDHSSCAAFTNPDGQHFILYDQNGTAMVDFQNNFGFTIDGEPCEYDQDFCLYRYKIEWSAVCKSMACNDPQVDVRIELEQKQLAGFIQVNAPTFVHTVGNDYVALKENCDTLGGEFIDDKCYLPKNKTDGGTSLTVCEYNQYPGGPILIAKGFNFEGKVQCGALMTGLCPAETPFWMGANPDGTPICSAPPAQAACPAGQVREGCSACKCPKTTIWNTATNTCEACVAQACTFPQIWDPDECACSCPGSQIWNGSACVAKCTNTCAANEYFDTDTCECSTDCTKDDTKCRPGFIAIKDAVKKECRCEPCPTCPRYSYCTEPTADNCWCYQRDGCAGMPIIGPPYNSAVSSCTGMTVTWGTQIGYSAPTANPGEYRPSHTEQCAQQNYSCPRTCPAGTYTPTQNAPTCLQCPVDTFSSAPGSAVCTPVGNGNFAAMGATAATPCTNAPGTATYTGPGGGANSCPFTCAPGSAGPTCTACAAGTYSPGGGAPCQGAGVGKYAPVGSSAPIDCSNGPGNSFYTGSGGGSDNCPWSCNFGYVNTGADCQPDPGPPCCGGPGT